MPCANLMLIHINTGEYPGGGVMDRTTELVKNKGYFTLMLTYVSVLSGDMIERYILNLC